MDVRGPLRVYEGFLPPLAAETDDFAALSDEALRVLRAALEPRRRAVIHELHQQERMRRKIESELASRGIDVSTPRNNTASFHSLSDAPPPPPPAPPPVESPRRRPSTQARILAPWTPTFELLSPSRRPSASPVSVTSLLLESADSRPGSASTVPPFRLEGGGTARRLSLSPGAGGDLPPIVEEVGRPALGGRLNPALFPAVFPDTVPVEAVQRLATKGGYADALSPASAGAADWAMLWVHYLALAAVPPGWEVERDASGRSYYFHPDTTTSSRQHPSRLVRECTARVPELRRDLGTLPPYWSDDYAAYPRALRSPSVPSARPYLLFAPWVPVLSEAIPPAVEFVNLVTNERSPAIPAEALERASIVITSAIRRHRARREAAAAREAGGGARWRGPKAVPAHAAPPARPAPHAAARPAARPHSALWRAAIVAQAAARRWLARRRLRRGRGDVDRPLLVGRGYVAPGSRARGTPPGSPLGPSRVDEVEWTPSPSPPPPPAPPMVPLPLPPVWVLHSPPSSRAIGRPPPSPARRSSRDEPAGIDASFAYLFDDFAKRASVPPPSLPPLADRGRAERPAVPVPPRTAPPAPARTASPPRPHPPAPAAGRRGRGRRRRVATASPPSRPPASARGSHRPRATDPVLQKPPARSEPEYFLRAESNPAPGRAGRWAAPAPRKPGSASGGTRG